MYTYIVMGVEGISRSLEFYVSVKIASLNWGVFCHQLLFPVLEFFLQHCSFGICLQQPFVPVEYDSDPKSSDQSLKSISSLQK